ncbi:hypothetical protein H0H87_002323 [Tephrocybe sp. NHM501043]|nr:hypothetical protein H0H87_002323 [Tephrocybe sp. NHM501043]
MAPTLTRLFGSLYAQIDGGHFGNALKTCDKILRIAPADPDATQTKLFLLLHTEAYDAALALTPHGFERAYSLYRLHREADAESVLAQLKGPDDRAAMHLEAQMAFRSAAYAPALTLYTALLESAAPGSEEHSDILTNLAAAQAHADFIDTGFLHALHALPPALAANIQTLPPPAPTPSALPHAEKENQNPTPAPAPKPPRRARIPPGVVPGVTPPPDPERWLKKSERSSFGSAKKRRAGGATQGAGVDPHPPTDAKPQMLKPKAKKRK